MKLFEKNVGKTDRIVRFVLGLALFAAGALYLGSPLAYAAYFVGLILIATGALGTCALYSLLNFTTLEPGEGCKCKEGEVCTCEPECKTCAPKSKEEMDAELKEIPIKAEKPAPAQREELSVEIPEEAEEKPFVPYTAPMASRSLMEKEPEKKRPAPVAPAAPAKRPAPAVKKAKKAPAKKASPKPKKAVKKKKK